MNRQITTLLKMLSEQGLNGTKVWEDVKHVALMAILASEEEMFNEFYDLVVANRLDRV